MSQLKEQNGRYYQECEVVMIATKNIVENGNQLHLHIKGNLVIPKTSGEAKRLRDYQNYKPQHLYITSNEEMKEKDWILFQFGSDLVEQVTKILPNGDIIVGENTHRHPKYCRKIITTTDESLEPRNLYGNSGLFKTKLPKPSDSFISKYIEEYNKGEKIENILVEYEKVYPKHFTYNPSENMFINLKVDSNNTITIKKVKDSYSREEIINLLYKYNDGIIDRYSQLTNKDLNKWVKENL